MNTEKLQKELNTINSLNSKELLEYSKDLAQKGEVSDLLFKAINERTKAINSGLDKQKECEMQVMIKKFSKGK